MRIFVTRRIQESALDRLRRRHEVAVWEQELPPGRADLIAGCEQADGVISLLTDTIDDALFECCPMLRAVSNYAVGFENVDIDAATRRGIPVGHTPDVLTEATAQLALTLTLDLMRRVAEADRVVRAGGWRTWEPRGFLGRELAQTTVGVVGYGRIGRRTAALLRALDVEVIHHDVGDSTGLSLDALLERSDVVSLHAALTPTSRGLIRRATLGRMRPGSLLVNVARGALVVTDDLVAALESGHLSGAALDVTDPEPLPASHPLLSLPNVIVTPHIASATTHARTAMADRAVDNLLSALDGAQMPFCANPKVYA
jgi:glyoxylate reductase